MKVPVGIITLTPQKVTLTKVLPGRTSAYLVSEVRPQVNGIIQKRLFTEGAGVSEGESLYQIDPALFKAAYDTAKAALQKAQAAQTTARFLAERYSEVIKVDGISRQEHDSAIAAYAQARAEVAAAKANLDTAQINLEYTKIKAPVSGHVGKSSVTPGALVTANQPTPLALVQQLDPMYVDVTQSSTEILRLKNALSEGRIGRGEESDASVSLTLEDGTAYPHQGVLKFSDVTVDQSTGSVALRAIFPNPDKLLFPGMFVRARLVQGVSESAILVPQQAVTHDAQGNATALVAVRKNGDSVVELRQLQVEQSIDGKNWLVTKGLVAGDQVIIEGLQKVKPGTPVTARDVSQASLAQ